MFSVPALFKEGDKCINQGSECVILDSRVSGTPDNFLIEYTIQYMNGEENLVEEDELEPLK